MAGVPREVPRADPRLDPRLVPGPGGPNVFGEEVQPGKEIVSRTNKEGNQIRKLK